MVGNGEAVVKGFLEGDQTHEGSSCFLKIHDGCWFLKHFFSEKNGGFLVVLQNLGLFPGVFMKKELVSSGVWLFSGCFCKGPHWGMSERPSCGIWLKSRMRLRQA